jgi:hypothetical protein
VAELSALELTAAVAQARAALDAATASRHHVYAGVRAEQVAALAACRTEVYSMIANDGFAGANGHRTLDRVQRALLRSLSSLRLAILGCI